MEACFVLVSQLSQFCFSDGEPVSGYLVSHSDDDGEWEEVETDMDMFKLRGLDCGTNYSVYVTAFNKIGRGLPSGIVSFKTLGSGAGYCQ